MNRNEAVFLTLLVLGFFGIVVTGFASPSQRMAKYIDAGYTILEARCAVYGENCDKIEVCKKKQ